MNKINGKKILPWAGMIVILYIMTLLQIPMVVRNLFFVVSSSICLYFIWKDASEERWEIPVLMLGLLARIAFCCLDVYTDFSLPIGGGDDGLAFMQTAVEYCNGDFHRVYTKYPYILYVIFQITGINQFAAQYVNILCWSFAALLLQKTCKRLNICGMFRLLALAVFAWLPTNIWITSILYRDTIVMLLLFLSFYYLICWMQEKGWSYIALSTVAVLLATLLHGGSIVSLVPIALVVIFYSKEKQQFCITKKNMLVVISMLIICVGLFLIPQIREVLLRKIPSMENGIIEGVNNWLKAKYDYSEGAGSNYMEGRYLTGYFDIIIMTIQKIYYHMFSPVPHMWRGITDAVAFFGSSAPVYFIVTMLWAVSIFYKKWDAYRFVLFIENFITIGIYAWGNVNGGTALRHREKILGLMILLGMYSLNIILQKRKEREGSEKITDN